MPRLSNSEKRESLNKKLADLQEELNKLDAADEKADKKLEIAIGEAILKQCRKMDPTCTSTDWKEYNYTHFAEQLSQILTAGNTVARIKNAIVDTTNYHQTRPAKSNVIGTDPVRTEKLREAKQGYNSYQQNEHQD